MRNLKYYSLITIVFTASFFATCASQAGTETTALKISDEKINQNLEQAEALFKQREDVSKLREAVRLIAAVRNPDARNFEVEWKFSKYNYFLGKQTDNEKESDAALEYGVQAGRIASRVEPNKPDGHFWYAANLGEQAKKSPVTVGIRAVDDIREAMNKVIAMQPDYQNASAYVALAQIELTTGLFGGKPEKAVEYLEKALDMDKQNKYIRLHLAEAYLAVDREADAKKQLETLLAMPPHPEYIVEHKETTEKAEKLLKTRF